jgi:hypothetical protein
MFLGRRSPSGLFAIVVLTAIEPKYVCGAATFSLRWHTETKSGHATKGQPRRNEYSGINGKHPLLGVVCRLTRCCWQTPDESHPGMDAVPVRRRFLYD